jgi:ATP-dependent Clp protease, protease subunit
MSQTISSLDWWAYNCTPADALAYREAEAANFVTVPTVITELSPGQHSGMDIFSAHLVKNRTIDITGPIDDMTQKVVTAQLIWLAAVDQKPIMIAINSPGGSVTAGNAIIDTMESLQRAGIDVNTRCNGLAASMGFMLLICGTNRFGQKRSNYMMHQPLIPQLGGKATEIWEHANKLMDTYRELALTIAEKTGRDFDEVFAAMKEDKWFNSPEAKDFGVIDFIIGIDDLEQV